MLSNLNNLVTVSLTGINIIFKNRLLYVNKIDGRKKQNGKYFCGIKVNQ